MSECACMQTGFFNWNNLRLLWQERGASMHKYRRVFMDHTLGMTWITMPEVDHKGCKVTAIRAESYAGDKGSWEVGIGGVGCRAVDGWTREKGASRCLKPLTATKTADPRTGTDSEELRGGLHWSQKSSLQQARPIESFMGPGNRKCKRYIFFPHTVL